MNIKDQVLSIEQVRELQELGFDVEKYASMCWVTYTSDEEPYEKDYNLSILDEFCYESASLEPTPTMTIGDIINILPVKIEEDYSVKIEEDYFLSVNLEYCAYSMVVGVDTMFFTSEKEFINNLFNTLVWCIKQEYIKI